MDFKNVIFMTDLDGTLLTDDKRVLEKDMEAIERFRAGGGIFTAATGRGYSMARRIVVDILNIEYPCVLFNGAGVFDFNKNEFLWHCEIGGQAYDYINFLAEDFPGQLGIEVLDKRNVYVPFINQMEQEHLEMEKVVPIMCKLEEIPEGDWLKILLAANPDVLDKVERYVESACRDAQWVRSAPVYLECLPKGVDKSKGFKELIRLVGAEGRFSVAAGDYMNDKAMIEKADLGAAPRNALDIVKQSADIVVCDNNSGSISEIINYIEKL